MHNQNTIFTLGTEAQLCLGDAVETLNQFPAESIDLIFADPPYGLSNGGFTCHAGRRASVNKGAWDKSRGIDADFEFHQRWITACRKVLKPNGTLWVSGTYHSIYTCGFALQKGGWHILNEIAWFKPNAVPHLACRMFAASHETLIWARKTKQARHLFNYADMRATDSGEDFFKKPERQMRSVWAFKQPPSVWLLNTPPAPEKKHGKHPTQKPLALMERIILACSNPRDTVLDPFCGSATTGVAALQHRRKFIGIDNSEEYLRSFAIPRIKDEIKNLKRSDKRNPQRQGVLYA